jgi:hypothetical protein
MEKQSPSRGNPKPGSLAPDIYFVTLLGLKRGYLDRSKKALFVHFSIFAMLKRQEY